MSSFLRWVEQLQFDFLLETLMLAAASVLCVAVHETCHGLCALWMGDDTAKRMGRLSLNPLRHVDPVGLVMMVIARFGWAKPVPVNMHKFRRPKLGMAVTALAGPVSNVLLMLLVALVRAGLIVLSFKAPSNVLQQCILFTEYVIILSAGLAVFNLFPVPPLDGSKVLFSVLPDRAYSFLMRYERYGMILLMVLLLTNILDTPLIWLRGCLLDALNFVTEPFYLLLLQLL